VVYPATLAIPTVPNRRFPGPVPEARFNAQGESQSPYASVEEMDANLDAIAVHFKLDKGLLTMTPEEVYGFVRVLDVDVPKNGEAG